jgi:hypothetical protein
MIADDLCKIVELLFHFELDFFIFRFNNEVKRTILCFEVVLMSGLD